ncbi:MAG: hypothetical protein WCO96_02810 [Actinomycetes bacterium]
MIASALAVSACGGGGSESGSTPTTVNASQQQQLESGVQALKTDAAELQGKLSACQSSGQGIGCIASVVEDFGADANNLGQTVDNVASQVSGECAAKLQATGNALETLGNDFENVGSSLTGGSFSAAVTKLQSLGAQANEIQQSLVSSGTAAAACQGGNG